MKVKDIMTQLESPESRHNTGYLIRMLMVNITLFCRRRKGKV